MTTRWGDGVTADLYMQGCDDRAREAVGRFERFACTPAGAERKMRLDAEIDVRPALPTVQAPTLVIHNEHDPVVNVAGGRELAAGIPNATLVELAGDFHAHWDPTRYDTLAGHIEEFLTGHVTPPADDVDRVLATVLFSDIVDSTRWPPRSAIVGGTPSSTNTTRSSGASSTATAAWRSTRPATGSWPRSTAPAGPSAAGTRSSTRHDHSACASGSVSTPASANGGATTSQGSPCTSVPGSPASPIPTKCSSRGPSKIWCPDRASSSLGGANTP